MAEKDKVISKNKIDKMIQFFAKSQKYQKIVKN